MKKIFTILAVFFSLSISAQNTHTQSSANTIEQFQGAVQTKVGLINAHFADTTEANFSWIKTKPFAQIVTGDGLTWLRNGTATRWIGTGTASISVSPDSTSIIICNGSGTCDTIPVVTVAPITNFTILNDTTIEVCGINSCDTIYTLPINYNQNVVNSVSVVNGVSVDSVFYFINGVKYLAGTIIHSSANISIYNDSTLLICNNTSCDTLIVPIVVQPVQNFTVLSDTTIQVCGAYGCDTININPTPFNKFYVDSVVINPGAVDTLKYWINGIPYIGGFINHLKVVNDGLISGGVVTYSGTGLTYYVSAATYVIGGEFYSSPDTTIILDAADGVNPRIDLFAVDTLGHVIKITGVAASTPLTPQVTPYQLALTTGITLAPNATQPTGTSSTIIYDENTEWTTGGTATVNYNSTANPYHGTKDALVSSYSKNSTLTFTGTTQTVNWQILRAFIYLNNANYSFQLRFYNGTTAVSNALTINGFGFNPALYNTYQNVSIPLSSFTWSGTSFDRLVITMTGKGAAGTYYIDYISLEGGTPVIPPVDNSSKVDSTTIKKINDSTYVDLYWVKGIPYQKGDTINIHSTTIDSINVSILNGGKIDTSHLPVSKLYIQQAGAGETQLVRASNDTTLSVATFKNTDDITINKASDSAVLIQFTHPHYTKAQVDSIKATITPSYVTSPVDSAAYHTSAVYQDTTLILKRPNGINDSISFHIGIPANGWLLGGNAGTKSDSNFIGTIDDAALTFKVNNNRSGLIDSTNLNNGKTLFGFRAGASITTETDVTAFGYKAANSITTGGFPTYYGNTAIGNRAMYSVTTTGYNTAVGYSALLSSTGTSNTAVGANAMTSTAGSNNTAVGNGAMLLNTGSNNVALGFLALNGGGGGSNTAIGVSALGNPSGISNAALGYSAGSGNGAGSRNLYLGQFAGAHNTNSDKIFISTQNRANITDEQTQSPFYASQSAVNNYNATTQYISLNGRISNNSLSSGAWWNLSRGDGVLSPLKFESPITISATGGSSTSTYFVINFATQTALPFVWGTQITLSGFTPSAYNGTWSVANATTSNVSVSASLNPGPVTVAGTITQGGLKPTPVYGEVENDSSALYISLGNGTNLSRSEIIKGRSGTATLSAGTVTVSTTFIKANSRILVSVATSSGTQGFLSAPTASIVAGTSFVINSTSATETSTVNWLIINP